MFKWIKKRRDRKNKAIAMAVRNELSAGGWEKFLPPVTIRDKMYMVTENGNIYRMDIDDLADMERIIQIRHN